MAEILFLVVATPLCLIAAYTDLRWMIIPNWVAIALLVGFVSVGVFVLPIETLGWRLLAGFIVLVIGFLLNAMGQIGGGDVKMLAAFTPYLTLIYIADFLMILSASLILTLVLHRLAKLIGPIRALTPDWESWDAGRYFPMGVSIATAAITYLLLIALPNM